MANWHDLFYDVRNREMAPESELFKFIALLEQSFGSMQILNLWDLGCGAGRHTVAMARSGHNVYASDNAPKAIELTIEWLVRSDANANVRLSEMVDFPWRDEDVKFHGVFSWDVLQHNTLNNIIKTIDLIHEKLFLGGLFIATIKSDKADLYGKGREIELKTFVLDVGKESGVPHHYFDEDGIRALFQADKWEIKALAEQIITNVERPDQFWEYTPFRSTTWCVLMQKK